MTTLHEWKCDRCGNTAWARGVPPQLKKPKPGAFAFMVKAVICQKCRWPMTNGTGQKRKHYSLRELL